MVLVVVVVLPSQSPLLRHHSCILGNLARCTIRDRRPCRSFPLAHHLRCSPSVVPVVVVPLRRVAASVASFCICCDPCSSRGVLLLVDLVVVVDLVVDSLLAAGMRLSPLWMVVAAVVVVVGMDALELVVLPQRTCVVSAAAAVSSLRLAVVVVVAVAVAVVVGRRDTEVEDQEVIDVDVVVVDPAVSVGKACCRRFSCSSS